MILSEDGTTTSTGGVSLATAETESWTRRENSAMTEIPGTRMGAVGDARWNQVSRVPCPQKEKPLSLAKLFAETP